MFEKFQIVSQLFEMRMEKCVVLISHESVQSNSIQPDHMPNAT